jgi:hypothetical protein
MVRDGLFAEFLAFDEAEPALLMAVRALLFLVDAFERAGAIGFFEREAAERVEAGRPGSRGGHQAAARAAAILQVRLINLPGGACPRGRGAIAAAGLGRAPRKEPEAVHRDPARGTAA